MTPFEEIRTACRTVSEAATHVRINHDRLRSFAATLSAPALLEFDPLYHFVGNDETTLTYIVILDTINFGSGWFPELKKLNGLGGYYTIATHLKNAFVDSGSFTANRLGSIKPSDCAEIFGQQGHVPELMTCFADALRELGDFIERNFNGSFLGLIESANHSAASLVMTLRNMSCFDDAALWHGLGVPFLKRAQIMAWDLSLAFQNKGIGRFDDIDQLTIFADNLVPHVLRVEGVLEYDRRLAKRIDAGAYLASGSEEEIELRAASIHAVELMSQQLGASAPRLDYLLWNNGQDAIYKKLPTHRSKTLFY